MKVVRVADGASRRAIQKKYFPKIVFLDLFVFLDLQIHKLQAVITRESASIPCVHTCLHQDWLVP